MGLHLYFAVQYSFDMLKKASFLLERAVFKISMDSRTPLRESYGKSKDFALYTIKYYYFVGETNPRPEIAALFKVFYLNISVF